MRNVIYLLASVLVCISCSTKNPEKAYQACITAEEAYNAMGEKYGKIAETGSLTEDEISAMEKESDALFENTKVVFARFYKNNINTAFGQQIFSESRWTRRLNPKQLESVVKAVTDKSFKESEAYKYATDRLFAMKYTQPGNPYTNIVSFNPQGNTIELAGYIGKGKYILLNFWASWCPDCRKEMPALAELYTDYKDKNFEIVGYSLDRDKDAWINGIESLNITWPQISDCDSWNSQGAKLYAVQWIPQTILINPEGIIIQRNSDIKNLREKLSNLIK